MTELKRCPFCGSESVGIRMDAEYIWCGCDHCGARTARYNHVLRDEYKRFEKFCECRDIAVRNWNRRADNA